MKSFSVFNVQFSYFLEKIKALSECYWTQEAKGMGGWGWGSEVKYDFHLGGEREKRRWKGGKR